MQICMPVVLIIADENMDRETIDVHEVRTLVNHGNNVCRYESGYVVFLKTTPGKKFFEWYVSKIVVDFVRRLKAAYDLNHEATAFLMHDGEYCQTNTWMTDTNELAEMFKMLHIAVPKTPKIRDSRKNSRKSRKNSRNSRKNTRRLPRIVLENQSQVPQVPLLLQIYSFLKHAKVF